MINDINNNKNLFFLNKMKLLLAPAVTTSMQSHNFSSSESAGFICFRISLIILFLSDKDHIPLLQQSTFFFLFILSLDDNGFFSVPSNTNSARNINRSIDTQNDKEYEKNF